MAGLYIHIPFCKQACYYCDFHFSVNQARKKELVNAIVHELILQKHYLRMPLETIYFGGGTPTVLSADEFRQIMETIQSNYLIRSSPEITMEANPEDLTAEKLDELKSGGINRLSIGIQSFSDDILAYLNRSHNARIAIDSVYKARDRGFSNISIDLIYSIPDQPEPVWRQNIETALSLKPDHISAYALTVENNTVFGRWTSKGKFTPKTDDTAADELDLLINKLEQAGYEHYEVSNFCKPGFHSKHNSSYWSGVEYLGVGPSAHSFNGITRQYNIYNNHHYIRSLNSGQIPSEVEVLTDEDRINEYLLITLRTRKGCNVNDLKTKLGFDLLSVQKKYIDELFSKNMAVLDNDVLRLTRAGMLLADKIASDMFILS